MIIIYNLSGLVLGAAGLIAGFFVVMVTGWLSPGLLTLGLVWLVGGLWWRKQGLAPGMKRPFPALFFIPLPFLAAPAFLAALLFLAVDLVGHSQPADPRAQLFRADERMLESAAATGDVQLSQQIIDALQAVPVEGKNALVYHVATRTNGDAVLVLVKAPALKNTKDNVRKMLLQQIEDSLRADEQLKNRRIFIGIKGQLTYGAVQTPPDAVQIGSVVPETRLYDFYGGSAAPSNVTLAESELGEREDFRMNIPAQRADSRDAPGDADVAAKDFPDKGADGPEGEPPDDNPEAKTSPEEKPSSRARDDEPETAQTAEDKAAPGAARPPESKPAPRAKVGKLVPRDRKEAPQTDKSKPSSKDRKRPSERLKEQRDERTAASKLRSADTSRAVRDLVTYRKKLQEIVDKYPETESGKKAAKLLEAE